MLSWLTTRFGHSPELLRLPALLAGTATIPVVYLLGSPHGRRAARGCWPRRSRPFSPFMIYYSADARAYGVMMFLATLVSTLWLLRALDTGRRRWWVLYAVAAAAAFYIALHVRVRAGGRSRLGALVAPRGAPRRRHRHRGGRGRWWSRGCPGLINDLQSPTLKILVALSPFTASDIRIDIHHWAVGYPDTFAGGLTELPGRLAADPVRRSRS